MSPVKNDNFGLAAAFSWTTRNHSHHEQDAARHKASASQGEAAMAVPATIAADATARLMTTPKAKRLDRTIALTTSSESAGHGTAQTRDLHHANNDGVFTAGSDV